MSEFIRLIVSDKEQTISRAKDLAERLDKVDVEGLDAYSGPKLPPIPAECCHPFHFKAATDSGKYCHPQVVMF